MKFIQYFHSDNNSSGPTAVVAQQVFLFFFFFYRSLTVGKQLLLHYCHLLDRSMKQDRSRN